MSDLNLFRYYQRLLSFSVGDETKTTLQDIADIMFTSSRHARSLLTQMQQKGVVELAPESWAEPTIDSYSEYGVRRFKRELGS